MSKLHLLPLLLAASLSGQKAYSQAVSAPVSDTSTIHRAEIQLPPFTLWNADGTTVDNAHLNPGGFWLMLYRDLNSSSGDEALTLLESLTVPAMGTPKAPLDPSLLVIVIAHATGAQVSQLQLNHPLLAKSVWLRDEKETAASALGLHGSPILIGMHEGYRRWQLAGSLESPSTQTAILSWLKHNALPANKLVLHKVKLTPPPSAHSNSASNPGVSH